MVSTRNPAGVLSVHAGFADEHIIQGIVEHMAHVKDTGYVRRRDYDRVRFTLIRFRMKEFMLKPVGVPLIFYL